jgi:hypothetical protein
MGAPMATPIFLLEIHFKTIGYQPRDPFTAMTLTKPPLAGKALIAIVHKNKQR